MALSEARQIALDMWEAIDRDNLVRPSANADASWKHWDNRTTVHIWLSTDDSEADWSVFETVIDRLPGTGYDPTVIADFIAVILMLTPGGSNGSPSRYR